MAALTYGRRLAPGLRTVVAMTCNQCHRLLPGDAFQRIPRVAGGPPYVDRRCRSCRWARMEASPGR
jgi:RNase P subunit RPR2